MEVIFLDDITGSVFSLSASGRIEVTDIESGKAILCSEQPDRVIDRASAIETVMSIIDSFEYPTLPAAS
ncbi:hypothetical protein GCM10023116_29560 [Kistimonas scapharcae]|uniref:Uncharacterized protein n=1 Tax=Kistimonas scapharcae TaxID=1036133 RepID=A0ABP8V368_9GAMM